MKAERRVLVIDQDEDWREFVKSALRRHGFRVKSICKPRDLVETLEREKFCLAFLGIDSLPELDSPLERPLREFLSRHERPVIVFQQPLAWPRSLDGIRRAFRMGAADLVEKTYVPGNLAAVVHSYVRGGECGNRTQDTRGGRHGI